MRKITERDVTVTIVREVDKDDGDMDVNVKIPGVGEALFLVHQPGMAVKVKGGFEMVHSDEVWVESFGFEPAEELILED